MLWCEGNNVDYVLGLAKNERLKKEIAAEIGQAKKIYEETGVRKVWVSLSESYPYQQLFKQVYENLRRLCPIPLRC